MVNSMKVVFSQLTEINESVDLALSLRLFHMSLSQILNMALS